MSERNRNKAILLVRERMVEARAREAAINAELDVLVVLEQKLMQAYARKSVRTPRIKAAPKPRTTNSDLAELGTGVVQ